MLINRRKKNLLTSVKIIEIFLFLLVGILVLFEAVWSYAQLEDLIKKSHQRQFQVLANATATSLSDIVIRHDYGQLESFLRLSMADASVTSILVVDNSGKVLVDLVKNRPGAEPTLVFDVRSINLQGINRNKDQRTSRFDKTFWATINPQSPIGWVRLDTSDYEARSLMQLNKTGVVIKASIVGSLFLLGLFSLIVYARKILTEKQNDFDRRNHELLDAAHMDTLTKIPNRRRFMELLNQLQLSRVTSNDKKPFAVCFMDLDQFKEVNDTFGHQIGDELLIQVTKRLLDILRASDVVARLGGDEFVLLLSDFGGRNQLKKLLNRIIDDINVSFIIQNHSIRVGISIGVTISPPDKGSDESLIKHADSAMYEAKKQGRNRWAIYDRKTST